MFSARLSLGLLIAVLSLGTFAQPIPHEPAAFTEYVASAVRREAGDIPVNVKAPLQLSVGSLTANLDRVHRFCQARGEACNAEIGQFVKAMVQVTRQQNEAPDRNAVQLVVRTEDYLKGAQSALGERGDALLAKPLVAGLMTVAVLDTPHTIRPLLGSDLKALDMSQEQVFELGAKNLLTGLQPLSTAAKPAASGQIGHLPPGYGEVGRVALAAQWEVLANAQRGELVIALPTTDQVLYVSESTPGALDALRTLSRRVASRSPNPLAPNMLLKWTPAGWVPVK